MQERAFSLRPSLALSSSSPSATGCFHRLSQTLTPELSDALKQSVWVLAQTTKPSRDSMPDLMDLIQTLLTGHKWSSRGLPSLFAASAKPAAAMSLNANVNC
jgi:hypothetical protein